ncbi:helix-turn-helix transcriptional regulator [Phytohabitans sp. ZYX-F-186]|uniref:Helix-turn-helix transcriptional regulator n=1 Tax=Phytohabitans maris TaxID=3071409 RepID=A0ABU0ZVU7_9ACTN|nr:helix-turn-helix transcriptional regulator [Phytohabitans sp. ZYX-F-186]MDQ7911149.1 helix-turn-helix transcriptional regulator [Phytohabitans sp. ZYX-F-186]
MSAWWFGALPAVRDLIDNQHSQATMQQPRTAVTMGQIPKELEPTRSVLHFFGAEVRRLRQTLGMSQADLGKLIFVHKDLIRKIEAAERMPAEELVNRCDDALSAGGALRRLWPMLERERRLRLSRDAAGSSVFRSEATDRPVLDWLLASTHDARRYRGDDEIASAAAEKLGQLRGVDHVHGAGHTYPDLAAVLDSDLDTLIARAPAVAAGFLELAGYEAVDLGADGRAQRHYLRALEIVTGVGDRLYGGYLIAVSLAHLALHCGDPDQAARLAAAALRGTEHQITPVVRATFRAVLARAHARRGDEAACAAALLQVEADLARGKPEDEPAWIRYFGEADLADEKAHCFFDLGLHELAQREATQAVTLLEPSRARRLAIDTALHAASLARARQIEHACAVGRRAVDHAAGLASFRSAHRIGLMMAELQPHADLPEVRDLAEYVHTRLPTLVTPHSR